MSEHTCGLRLSGFGDEIDPDPVVQTAVLAALGAHYIEVRSAWGVNIVDLDPTRLTELAGVIRGRGMSVSAIASPVGKADIADPAEGEPDRLRRAIRAAQELEADYIRVFSYYHRNADPADVREQVLDRMAALADLASDAGVTLVLENEEGLYGDTPERILDIIATVGSRALRVAWDPGNYAELGIDPFADAYPILRGHLEYFQVKDACAGDPQMRVAGEGEGRIRETIRALRDSGFVGYASMEPHLSQYTDRGGFSGPAEFGRATRAFTALAAEEGMPLL